MYQECQPHSHHSSHSISPNCLRYDLLPRPLYRHRESLLIKKLVFFRNSLSVGLFAVQCVDLLIRAITYRDGRFQLADEIVNVNGASLRYQTCISDMSEESHKFKGKF